MFSPFLQEMLGSFAKFKSGKLDFMFKPEAKVVKPAEVKPNRTPMVDPKTKPTAKPQKAQDSELKRLEKEVFEHPMAK
jgi:hypothetical protein